MNRLTGLAFGLLCVLWVIAWKKGARGPAWALAAAPMLWLSPALAMIGQVLPAAP